MKKIIVIVLSVLMLLTTCGCKQIHPIDPIDDPVINEISFVNDLSKTVKGSLINSADKYPDLNSLAISLYKQMDGDNVVFSPASLLTCLAMLSAGSNGVTKQDLEKFFGYSIDELNTLENNLLSKLVSVSGNTKLQIANSVWLNEGFKSKEEYIQSVVDYYNGQIYQGKLTDKRVVDDINGWININTNGLIKKMFDEPFSEYTMMVLINSIYFKGNWVKKFEESNTNTNTFYLGNGKTVDTDFMYQQSRMPYFKNDKIEAVVLDYDDFENCFIAIKGNDIDFKQLNNLISSELLEDILINSTRETINLSLPKFEKESYMILQPLLEKAGLENMFTDNADFTNIANGLKVSSVLQKTKIKVYEEGSEAAAVTVIVTDLTAMPQENDIIEVRYDEPFVYIIYNVETNTILFIGNVINPTN